MNFEEYTTPLLKQLVHDLIERDLYGHIGSIANILSAFKSSRWQQLPQDEQHHWINNLIQIIAGKDGLFESFGFEDENLNNLLAALQVKEKKLK